MTGKLCVQAMGKWISGALLTAALLFFPAGTAAYPNGWLLMAVLFIPMLIAGVVMLVKRPDLLRKRLHTKEKERGQKAVIACSGVMFVGGFILAGLDYRFGWSALPTWLIALAVLLFFCAYLLYAEVLRENAFLSRTIEVQQGQKVIDTGLYGVVRHPMYAATILLFLSMPLILGSWVSFLLFLVYPVLIVKRINGEEKVLEQGLPGYAEYRLRVKYKLIPFVW